MYKFFRFKNYTLEFGIFHRLAYEGKGFDCAIRYCPKGSGDHTPAFYFFTNVGIFGILTIEWYSVYHLNEEENNFPMEIS